MPEPQRIWNRKYRARLNTAEKPTVYEIIYPDGTHDKVKEADYDYYKKDYLKIKGIRIMRDGVVIK